MVEMTRGQVVTLEEYSKREVFRKFFASSTDAIKEDRNTVNVDTWYYHIDTWYYSQDSEVNPANLLLAEYYGGSLNLGTFSKVNRFGR